jgi:GNAT superfamily N-acetyltransferase
MTDIISHASEADVPAIADLVNRSYRPTSDDAGWTHEAALVAGPRTSADQVHALFQDGSIVLIIMRDEDLIACVHVLNEGEAYWIGMLATEPKLQGHGVGKAMLEAAELLAMQTLQARGLRMSVLSSRPELQALLTDTIQPPTQRVPPMRSDLLVRSMVKHLTPFPS